MSADTVERLRKQHEQAKTAGLASEDGSTTFSLAADEIERLRSDVAVSKAMGAFYKKLTEVRRPQANAALDRETVERCAITAETCSVEDAHWRRDIAKAIRSLLEEK